MLPAPSYLSVNHLLAACLRHWYSSRYLQISPLHLEFWLPLSDSSPAVSNAVPGLSPGISHQTCRTAYIPFTPNNSEQRSQLTCYRGCWHVISRCLFRRYRHRTRISSRTYSLRPKGLYNLPAFIIHAASLRQGFPHCGIFLAAASRRSLGRISVPMCPFTLSGRIAIVALVGRYPANQLIARGPFLRRGRSRFLRLPPRRRSYPVLPGISTGYPRPEGASPTRSSPVRHSREGASSFLAVRLACLRRAASVRSEPGSNSP